MERNILVIKSAKIETKFLTENELPLSARPQYADDHSEEMPEVKVNPESKATPGILNYTADFSISIQFSSIYHFSKQELRQVNRAPLRLRLNIPKV